MTYARHQGAVVEVIHVNWTKRVFEYLQKQYSDKLVAVKNQRGETYTVPFPELEWKNEEKAE